MLATREESPQEDEGVPLLSSMIFSNEVPTDKYRLAYAVFVIQGLGILLPWNAFISAADYFTKLYGASFVFFISLVFNWSGALCYLFVKILPRFSPLHRVLVSLALFFVVLLVTPFLEPLPRNLSKSITLVGVFIAGIAAAILQSSVAGMAALFPPDYMGGMMSGCGIAGLVAIALRIITKGSMGDSTDSDMDPSVTLFFVLAASVTILCAGSFIYLWRLPVTKHHLCSYEQLKVHEKPEVLEANSNIKIVFRKVWKEVAVIIITFFITLALFPGMTGLVKPHSQKISADWFSILFTALFMFFDFAGRTLPQWVRIFSPTVLPLPALARFVFFPLILICIHPRIIENDYATCIIIAIFALSNGYCTTLAMIYGPQQVSPGEKEMAGMVLSGCLTIGIILGSHFALLMLYLVTGSVGL